MKPLSIRPETLTSTSLQSREIKIRMWQLRVKERQSQGQFIFYFIKLKKTAGFLCRRHSVSLVYLNMTETFRKKGVLYALPTRWCTSVFSQLMAFSISNYRPIH
jgi:hypothetical protein